MSGTGEKRKVNVLPLESEDKMPLEGEDKKMVLATARNWALKRQERPIVQLLWPLNGEQFLPPDVVSPSSHHVVDSRWWWW